MVLGGQKMKLFTFAIGSALILALSFSFIGISKAGPVELETDAGVITMVATVEEIDVDNQLITVVGPNGNSIVVQIKPEHLALIKVKDKVTISYADEMAVALRRSAGPPKATANPIAQLETGDMNMTPPTIAQQTDVDATPDGATNFTTTELTVTVAAVNHRKRTITFDGPGGVRRTIFIGPAVQGLEQVEAGDEVVLLITRAVAIDIKPA
jgi:hypothetical protein